GGFAALLPGGDNSSAVEEQLSRHRATGKLAQVPRDHARDLGQDTAIRARESAGAQDVQRMGVCREGKSSRGNRCGTEPAAERRKKVAPVVRPGLLAKSHR